MIKWCGWNLSDNLEKADITWTRERTFLIFLQAAFTLNISLDMCFFFKTAICEAVAPDLKGYWHNHPSLYPAVERNRVSVLTLGHHPDVGVWWIFCWQCATVLLPVTANWQTNLFLTLMLWTSGQDVPTESAKYNAKKWHVGGEVTIPNTIWEKCNNPSVENKTGTCHES